MLSTPRIHPLSPDEIKSISGQFNREGISLRIAHLATKTKRKTASATNVGKTLFNHSELALSWFLFARHILIKNTLRPRDRELVILRVGWICKADYEWAHHTRIGKHVGLSDKEIELIKIGSEAKEWSEYDANLLRAVEQLLENTFIEDKTWNALCEKLHTKQMMDLVFTVGQYNMVSMALNSFGVQIETQ